MASLFERRPRLYREHLFDDLPVELRWEAEGWLALWYERRNGNVPSWLRPILIGRARYLALNPRWAFWMLAKSGGHALQRKLRNEGRAGTKHPYLLKARSVITARRRGQREERERERLSLPPRTRHRLLPLD